MLSYLAAGVFVALAAVVASECPAGWLEFGPKCYFESHDAETWAGALKLCKFLEGDLVMIDSEEENLFLANHSRHSFNHDHGQPADYWIGLHDIEKEGLYMWVQTRTPLADNQARWGPGQPDNLNRDQNCVFLKGNDNGNWYDGHCNNVKHYICEKVSSDGMEILR